jgi:hypothetical protein
VLLSINARPATASVVGNLAGLPAAANTDVVTGLASIPEPAAMSLTLAAGAAAVVMRRRRRRLSRPLLVTHRAS